MGSIYKLYEKNTSGIKKKIRELADRAETRQALEYIRCMEPETITIQKELALIEAPTFYEQKRGEQLRRLFSGFGLDAVTMDALGNVYGTLRGKNQNNGEIKAGEDCIVIEAHMDTVFPFGTVKSVHQDGTCLFCPGISDNTRGLALLCSLIRCFKANKIEPDKSIIFLATVREEGLGGFGGIRYFLEQHPRIEACVSVDGPDSDCVIYGGPGIQNWRVKFQSEGGHAFKHYGIVGNPIHAAVRAMNQLITVRLPDTPKTTFEITGFSAGTTEGIGAIPAVAELNLNFRSTDEIKLQKLVQLVKEAIEKGVRDENTYIGHESVHFKIEITADVPVSSQASDNYMVSSMAAVIRHLEMKPTLDGSCPTNASITIGKGIPGICIGGGGRAGANHSMAEWFDTMGSYLGVQAAFLELMLLSSD